MQELQLPLVVLQYLPQHAHHIQELMFGFRLLFLLAEQLLLVLNLE
jgi:hypothetical protein